MARDSSGGRFRVIVAGFLAGAAGAVLATALSPRRRLDVRLIRGLRRATPPPPTVLVPGLLGSELVRPDGTHVWLNLGNAIGHHDLSLPLRLPLAESRDDLRPGGLLGAGTVLPRVFGFTEYADLVELLDSAGLVRVVPGPRPWFHLFTYDWRRDLVESARALHDRLEALADAAGDPGLRFNVVGHSMGGLVARYYLRYGVAEPDEDAPVTWAGARRIQNLVLVATPNAGSIPALDAILSGARVGLSYTTMAASVIARMPAMYQLLPPAGAPALLDHRGEPLSADLHDIGTWERRGWGPFQSYPARRAGDRPMVDPAAHRRFLAAVLARSRAFHRALGRPPATPCPARVVVLGGDCLPTLARAIVPERLGVPPRFEAHTAREQEAMFEAGDGRVTRTSVLASHQAGADETETGSGIPEVTQAFLGSAEHHGIYSEPTFQSILLRLLLRPALATTGGLRPPVVATAQRQRRGGGRGGDRPGESLP